VALMQTFFDLVADLLRLVGDSIHSAFASVFFAALAGRLAWHTRLVQKGERKFFSKEMVYEALIVLFLFYVSQSAIAALVIFFGVEPVHADQLAQGLAAIIAYFGPGGLQAAILAIWDKFWSKPA
tara:strand:- start:998 stop:1372 length:375 start_codon:yes stop_codon:yes gene_type:complete